MNFFKTPLRYPGGKSKAIKQISAYLPSHFAEYREPFIGGGSVFIYLKQLYPDRTYWINDLNFDLYLFWQYAQTHLDQLIAEIYTIKNHYQEGRVLFEHYRKASALSELERAVRFFVMNRITFSGTVDSGGYSQQAFDKRFTVSAIERLRPLDTLLQHTHITHSDYRAVINAPGQAVFIFLDPPYYSATHSRLYGRKGQLHLDFDHAAFAATLADCPHDHQWLITYDDCPEIRKNFQFANIYEWELQYGMNNYKQKTAAKGKELFITNYEVSLLK